MLLPLRADASEKREVIIYTYHLKPPFVIDEENGSGFDFDLSAFLNSQGSTYHFVTKYLPRKRLDLYMSKSGFDGIVTGTNPYWMGDAEQKKYLWTPSILKDRDEVVSLHISPVNYKNPLSLFGLKVGTVLEFKYFGLDEFMQEGKIIRKDTASESQNLHKLLAGRVDAVIVGRSTLDYFVKLHDCRAQLYISPQPHASYDRNILIPLNNKDIHDWLVPIVKDLNSNQEWQKLLKKYELQE
jgi:polar amino acid transport system substrate-binding protein